MNASAIPRVMRQYPAIVGAKSNEKATLRVPPDFDRSYLESIRLILAVPEIELEVVGPLVWEEEANEILPRQEVKGTEVFYSVCPSFEPSRAVKLAYDQSQSSYRISRSVGPAHKENEGEFHDVGCAGGAEEVEDLLVAVLRCSVPLNQGICMGVDGTDYRLTIRQGFNSIRMAWWSGSASLPEPVWRLVDFLNKWTECQPAAAPDAESRR